MNLDCFGRWKKTLGLRWETVRVLGLVGCGGAQGSDLLGQRARSRGGDGERLGERPHPGRRRCSSVGCTLSIPRPFSLGSVDTGQAAEGAAHWCLQIWVLGSREEAPSC